jgi:regulator of sigma E protease
MDVLKTAFYFIAVLSILVIVHEWGHFIVAKLCKMRVEDFSLFFGKRLLRLGVRNGTEYNIRSVPLGGFVKIAGMEPDDISNGAPIFKRRGGNAASNTPEKTLRGLSEETLEGIDMETVSERVRQIVDQSVGADSHLTAEGRQELQSLLVSTGINAEEHRYIEAILGADMDRPDPNGYNQKPLWQRAVVIFAGPFMSLFFGYALFCGMGFTTGLPDRQDNSIEMVFKGKPAAQAGLQPGDRIVEINGKAINDAESMVKSIHDSPGRPLHLIVLRDDQRVPYTITPYAFQYPDVENGKKVTKTIGLLGFAPGAAWKQYTPIVAIKRGTEIVRFEVTMTLQGLFSKSVRENVGGPVAIADKIHDDSKQGPRQVMFTAAMLSVSLGLVNLFPIPILDGGHLLLLAIEGIRRRKLSSREVYTAQMVGLSIIGVLFVLVMYNDILRILPGGSGMP